MVLGKLPVPGRPIICITVGQGPTALASPCWDWKTLSVNPAEKGYLFQIREG